MRMQMHLPVTTHMSSSAEESCQEKEKLGSNQHSWLDTSPGCCCAGFKSSAIRKRYLPWATRSYRVTKTVFTSSLLSCLAEWTVTSYVDVYRQAPLHSTGPTLLVSVIVLSCHPNLLLGCDLDCMLHDTNMHVHAVTD